MIISQHVANSGECGMIYSLIRRSDLNMEGSQQGLLTGNSCISWRRQCCMGGFMWRLHRYFARRLWHQKVWKLFKMICSQTTEGLFTQEPAKQVFLGVWEAFYIRALRANEAREGSLPAFLFLFSEICQWYLDWSRYNDNHMNDLECCFPWWRAVW